MVTLHNMSKLSIKKLIKMQFVNIKHIKIRRHFNQCFVSAEHSRK